MARVERRFQLANDLDAEGLACTSEGLSLAGAPFLRRTATAWERRSAEEIAALMKAAYGEDVNPGRLASGLDVIVQALNNGDLGRAMVAAVHLQLPPLSADAVERIAKTNGALMKYDPSEPRDERGRWTTGTGGAEGQATRNDGHARAHAGLGGDPRDQSLLIPVSSRVCPWVTAFRNQHLSDAIKLAAVIGHGATADEILAVSGNESTYGSDTKAAVHGNFFGIHFPGTDPSKYFAGQNGVFPTKRDGPMASFDLKNAYYQSGLVFANTMAASWRGQDFSNPDALFSLAHAHGWGTETVNYVPKLLNIYGLFRNSARLSESRS